MRLSEWAWKDDPEETPAGGEDARVEGWLNSVNSTVKPPLDNHSEVASMYDNKAPSIVVSENIPPNTRAQPNVNAPHRHIIQMPAHSIVSSTRLDTERFWDAIHQEYICPGEKCRRHFKSPHDFQKHLLTSAHVGGTVVCPSCLKRFATTTAWVAHTESASTGLAMDSVGRALVALMA